MIVTFFKSYATVLVYFAICAGCALSLKRFVAVPREVFRKILHFILLGSIFIFTYMVDTWWIAAIETVTFMAMVYPALIFAECLPGFSELLVERKRGEIKTSLLVVFSMFLALICICWGWLGEKYLVIASVLAWGFGDAAAALVGKRFGKNYIVGKMVEGRKSFEGSLAMFIVAFVAVITVLYLNVPMRWQAYVAIAIITAAVCAVVELFTKNGMDTWTCPFSAAFTMIVLLRFMGLVSLV